MNEVSYANLVRCYEDCIKRISVIVEAWDISLSFSDPASHKDEILAPIMRDADGGSNRYYEDFRELYPYAKPVKP